MGCNQSKNRVVPVNFDVVPQCKRTWFQTNVNRVKGRARKARQAFLKCFNRSSKKIDNVVVPANCKPNVEEDLKIEDISSTSEIADSMSGSVSGSVSESWSSDLPSSGSESVLDFVTLGPFKSPSGHWVMIDKTREEVLQLNLAKEGFEIDPVARDGDCFFVSAARQLSRAEPCIDTTAAQLRQDLVRYIRANAEEYAIAVPGTFWTFLGQLNSLAQQGHWCSDLADVLHIALADYTSRKVVLITSTAEQSTFVTPFEGEQSGSPVVLAYLNKPGREHYDAVRKVG
ncbi:Hypp3738 [Branchiostoma lanceolatum]|uniref:Small ribosomal subunit protein mS31 n=1 Tax=Branchiostoma lanceolatum TaxID=7740 RepID=A0A8K0A4L2_BRALA|nr:Hypp3738 [Branchiostoma lanceolatum]